MRPAPRIMWPTSELPIWPSGKPTSIPDIERLELGKSRSNASIFGIDAFAMALPSFLGLIPNPSRMTRIAGCVLVTGFPSFGVGTGGESCGNARRSKTVGLTQSETGRPRSNKAQAARPEGRGPIVRLDRKIGGPVHRKCGRRRLKSPSKSNGPDWRLQRTAEKYWLDSRPLQDLAQYSEPADPNAPCK